MEKHSGCIPGGITLRNVIALSPKAFVPVRIIVIFVGLKLPYHQTASIRSRTNRR